MNRRLWLQKIEAEAKTLRELELAHILSQPYPWPHTRVHLRMMKWAIKHKDIKELLAQIPRVLLAFPSSLLGFAPPGNPGSGRWGIAKRHSWPLELPPELEDQR